MYCSLLTSWWRITEYAFSARSFIFWTFNLLVLNKGFVTCVYSLWGLRPPSFIQCLQERIIWHTAQSYTYCGETVITFQWHWLLYDSLYSSLTTLHCCRKHFARKGLASPLSSMQTSTRTSTRQKQSPVLFPFSSCHISIKSLFTSVAHRICKLLWTVLSVLCFLSAKSTPGIFFRCPETSNCSIISKISKRWLLDYSSKGK